MRHFDLRSLIEKDNLINYNVRSISVIFCSTVITMDEVFLTGKWTKCKLIAVSDS